MPDETRDAVYRLLGQEAPPTAPENADTFTLADRLLTGETPEEQRTRRMQAATQEAATRQGNPLPAAVRATPFAGTLANVFGADAVRKAQQRYDEGTATADDYKALATSQSEAARRQDQSTLGMFAEGVPDLVGLMGEATGAGVLTSGGRLATMGGVKGLAARAAVMTPAIPAAYAPRAVSNAAEYGGDPTDAANVAPALAYGTAQMAILNSLTKAFPAIDKVVGKIPTAVGRTMAARSVARGAIGVGEQQALDAGASALDKAAEETIGKSLRIGTKYGTLGSMIQGEKGSMKEAVVQLLTFSLFGGMHEAQAKRAAGRPTTEPQRQSQNPIAEPPTPETTVPAEVAASSQNTAEPSTQPTASSVIAESPAPVRPSAEWTEPPQVLPTAPEPKPTESAPRGEVVLSEFGKAADALKARGLSNEKAGALLVEAGNLVTREIERNPTVTPEQVEAAVKRVPIPALQDYVRTLFDTVSPSRQLPERATPGPVEPMIGPERAVATRPQPEAPPVESAVPPREAAVADLIRRTGVSRQVAESRVPPAESAPPQVSTWTPDAPTVEPQTVASPSVESTQPTPPAPVAMPARTPTTAQVVSKAKRQAAAEEFKRLEREVENTEDPTRLADLRYRMVQAEMDAKGLTQKQKFVVEQYAQRRTMEDIAAEMGVSKQVVGEHLQKAAARLERPMSFAKSGTGGKAAELSDRASRAAEMREQQTTQDDSGRRIPRMELEEGDIQRMADEAAGPKIARMEGELNDAAMAEMFLNQRFGESKDINRAAVAKSLVAQGLARSKGEAEAVIKKVEASEAWKTLIESVKEHKLDERPVRKEGRKAALPKSEVRRELARVQAEADRDAAAEAARIAGQEADRPAAEVTPAVRESLDALAETMAEVTQGRNEGGPLPTPATREESVARRQAMIQAWMMEREGARMGNEAVRKAGADAMRRLGAEPIAEVGDVVPYDGARHNLQGKLGDADNVRVEHPGWRFTDEMGGENVVAPARVKAAPGANVGTPDAVPDGPVVDFLKREAGSQVFDPAFYGKIAEAIGLRPGKWLRSRGDLTPEVYEAKQRKEGTENAYADDAKNSLRDLRKSVGWYAKLPEAQVLRIDDALRGNKAAMASLSKQTRRAVKAMRFDMDQLADALIAADAIPKEMIPTVQANKGSYLMRQYRIFNVEGFAAEALADTAKVDAFENRLRIERAKRGMPTDAASLRGVTKNLLDKAYEAGSPAGLISGSTLGAKDRSIITGRKNLWPELRELWGEERDPIVNYATTMAKQSHLLASHQFLKEVRAAGMGKFLSETPTPEMFRQLTSKKSKVMDAINGPRGEPVYTTPELAEAMTEIFEPKQQEGAIRAYMAAVGAAKQAKTVFSPTTTARNYLSGAGFAIANGHYRAGWFPQVMRTLFTDTPASRAEHRRLEELGITGDGVAEGEFRQFGKDALAQRANDPMLQMGLLSDKLAVRAIKSGAKTAQKIYRTGDSIWKAYGYYNEVARWSKAEPTWSREQVEQHAASIVRDTYQTYSKLPKLIRASRGVPGAPFMSFPSEVVRTTFKTFEHAASELRSSNPEVRKIGATRAAGLIASYLAASTAAYVSAKAVGLTGDEEEAVRRNLPDWSKDSSLLHTGRDEKGNPEHIDISNTDPHGFLVKPIIALLRGEDWREALVNAKDSLVTPFVAEDIVTGKVMDVARNYTQDGRRVTNPQADDAERRTDQALHLATAVTPGVVDSAIRGYNSDKPEREVAANITGQRLTTLDRDKAVASKARAFQAAKQNTAKMLTEVGRQKGVVSDAELRAAYDKADAARRQVYEEMRKDVQSAITLGLTERQIRESLKKTGVSLADTGDLLAGRYRGYEPDEVGGPDPKEAARRLKVVRDYMRQKSTRSPSGR